MIGAELPEDLYAEILRLSAAGDTAAEVGDSMAACALYSQALDLLPEPRHHWEAYTWLASAIGDVHWLDRAFASARKWFSEAMNGPEGNVNAFVNMRLGQCYLELHDGVQASEFLLRAYLLGGKGVFRSEDLKYLMYIAKHIH